MTKDKKSAFPGSMLEHKDAAKAEAEKVGAKIDEAFGKLAKKMRERADKPRRRWKGRGSQKSVLSCCDASSCTRMRRPISKNVFLNATTIRPSLTLGDVCNEWSSAGPLRAGKSVSAQAAVPPAQASQRKLCVGLF